MNNLILKRKRPFRPLLICVMAALLAATGCVLSTPEITTRHSTQVFSPKSPAPASFYIFTYNVAIVPPDAVMEIFSAIRQALTPISLSEEIKGHLELSHDEKFLKEAIVEAADNGADYLIVFQIEQWNKPVHYTQYSYAYSLNTTAYEISLIVSIYDAPGGKLLHRDVVGGEYEPYKGQRDECLSRMFEEWKERKFKLPKPE